MKQVFLGGSCYPTTWREDIVIPTLKNFGITYYNPQVKNWNPELIESEHYAKQQATVALFVIDNQTRAISSLIEVAHLIGFGKKLVLTVESGPVENQKIRDETISKDDRAELLWGRKIIKNLAKLYGTPTFDNVCAATQHVKHILKKDGMENEKTTTTGEISHQSKPTDVFIVGRATNVFPFDSISKNTRFISCDQRFSEKDMIETDERSIALFIISDTSRSLPEMIMAAHFIGLGRNVILCVLELYKGLIVGNHSLSELETNDYNRGRKYLMDMATRNNVVIFNNILEAIEFINLSN